MLTLSDSEKESDGDEIPDVGLLKRQSTVLLSREEVDRVLKSVKCPVEAEYEKMEKILAFDCKYAGGGGKENTQKVVV